MVHALDEAGIAHMVIGSLASAYHGEPRATRDIDEVIDPDGGSIELLVEAFPSDRFYVRAYLRRWAQELGVGPLLEQLGAEAEVERSP